MKKQILVFLTVISLFMSFALALAVDIMPIDQVKTGMRGIAKTVVEGMRIDEYNVEILGVVKNYGSMGNRILVRVSGAVVDKSGGIAEGMSGSPVYINGKIVGAVSSGWSFADHKVGFVTPIEDMLKIFDIANPPPIQQPQASPNNEKTLTDEQFDKSIQDIIAKIRKQINAADIQDESNITVVPKTQLFAGGFSPQAITKLQSRLKDYKIVDYSAASGIPDGVVVGPLQPGSTVGAELVRGDTIMGAIGTVTYIDGDKILAFGHPFLQKGASKYIMTNGYIFTVIDSIDSAFKLGVAGEPIGIINQDRSNGVAGVVGQYPNVVPLSVTVKDATTNSTKTFWAQTIIDETMTPELQSQSVVSFIDRTLDRVGQGTAKVSYDITARYMPGLEVKRSNMFYSDKNISAECVGEFRELMAELTDNRFNPVELLQVSVDVEITEDKLLAAIVSAKADKTTVHPGEKVAVEVQTRPYRGDVQKQVLTYTIPADQKPGEVMLEVRGGSQQTVADMLNSQQQLANADLMQVLKLTRIKDTSFEDALKEMLASDCNDEIVVEQLDFPPELIAQRAVASKHQNDEAAARIHGLSYPMGIDLTTNMMDADAGSHAANSKESSDGANKPFVDKSKVKTKTGYIILGDTQVVLNVVPAGK